MLFYPLQNHPDKFTPILVRRDLNAYLKVNGTVQHGLKERRSEFVISAFTGKHFLGRESHWSVWAEIPPESDSAWKLANLLVPEENRTVLVILPQPVVLRSLIIPPGIHFGFYFNNNWRIYQRNQGARITENEQLSNDRCWIEISNRQISSWLELPQLEINAQLRSVGT
jgi:hypothetical protein